MLLEENPFIVPHLKALISGQKLWGGQWCGSILSLWNALLKISILLHKVAFVQSQRSRTVSDESLYILPHLKALISGQKF